MVIKPISEISKPLNPQKVEKRERVNGESVGRDDKVVISQEGKKLHQVQQVSNVISGVPDIRAEKVKEVRERLNAGYYSERQIVERIAERIAETLGL